MKTRYVIVVLASFVMFSCGTSNYFADTYEDDIYFTPSDQKEIKYVERTNEEIAIKDSDKHDNQEFQKEMTEWIKNPKTKSDTTIKFESKGWINFSGGKSDLKYAERMRRWYGPMNSRHLPFHMYDEDWLINDPDWNVYVDGSEIYYVPSWSNPMYHNYRYGIGIRHNFFTYRHGWAPYHNFYGVPFSHHYGSYDPYWHDWYYTWNDPFLYDSFYGMGNMYGYGLGFGYGIGYGSNFGYPHHGFAQSYYGYGGYGHGLFGYPYYGGRYGYHYGGMNYGFVNKQTYESYKKSKVEHQSFRKYNARAPRYDKSKTVSKELRRKYYKQRPKGNLKYSKPNRGTTQSSTDRYNAGNSRNSSIKNNSTNSSSSGRQYNSGSSSTTRQRSSSSGSSRRRR